MKPQFTIPVPCHENWNNMSSAENGRFCSSCVKSVIDFTVMDDAEITAYIQQNSDKRICGRFRNQQLEPPQLLIPESFLTTKMPFHRAFFFAALVVMGSTLFSCKDHSGETMGDIAVVEDTVPAAVDTNSFRHTLDTMALPEKSAAPVKDTTKIMHTLGIMAVPPKSSDTVHVSKNKSVPITKQDSPH